MNKTALVITALAVIGAAGIDNTVEASSPQPIQPLCTDTYIITEGDTLAEIAQNQQTTIALIAHQNPNLTNINQIETGETLCISSTSQTANPNNTGNEIMSSTSTSEITSTPPMNNQIPENPGKLTTVFINAAKHCPGLQWKYLAGIARIETRYGTHGGSQVDDNNNITKEIVSSTGARGPMQHMPLSWKTFGSGNINNFDDAAAASARHLCEGNIIDGTPESIYKALRRYYTGRTSYTNAGNGYADKVFKFADSHDVNT